MFRLKKNLNFSIKFYTNVINIMTYFNEFIQIFERNENSFNCIHIMSTTNVTKCATLGKMQAAAREKITEYEIADRPRIHCQLSRRHSNKKKRTSVINSRFIVVMKFQYQFCN